MLSGRRYDGESSLAAGIVDAVGAPEELVGVATGISAARVGKERALTRTLMGDLYASILANLE